MKPSPRDQAIFIHSLWRSGSTYIFNAFRRSKAGYWAYQEPVHEIVLSAKDNPDVLASCTSETLATLRHPQLEKPYFYELQQTHQAWHDFVIEKKIIYDDYFGASSIEPLKRYLQALISSAHGRPVIQECRTSCRIAALKQALGGTHIYLWRNPWDQWWSYKSTYYFDITSQLILNAPSHPDVITRLRGEIGFKEFHDADISKEFAHFDRKRLPADRSYLVFYLLWCLGLLEGMGSADILLNIDALSLDNAYRDDVQNHLLQFDITDIDFSDCKIPQTYYDEKDRAFFEAQEDRAHAFLLMSGYSKSALKKLAKLRQSNEPKLWEIPVSEISAEKILLDSFRAREIVLRAETENAARLIHEADLQAQELRLQEQKAAAQLLAVQQQAEQEKAEQAHNHREQESALHRQHSEREEALSGLVRQTMEDARQAAQIHLRDIVRSDRAFAEQLSVVQREAHQAVAEQARNHSEQASAMQREHAEREQTLRQQLQAAQQELRYSARVWADEQFQLNEQLRTELEASQKLQQAFNALQDELTAMCNDLSWRLTAPGRAVAGWFRSLRTQTCHAVSAAEQQDGAPLSHSVPGTVTSCSHEFTPNLPFTETTNTISEQSAQNSRYPPCQ